MLSTLLVGGRDISVVQHMAQFISLYSGRNEITARNGISALTFKYKYGDVLQTFET